MGVSGTSIFANDIACDVRGDYRELIEDGVDDAEATRKIIAKYQKWFDDPESGTAALVGFAVTQSKIGRLDPSIRDRAIALIDRGGDLDVWARDSPKDLGKRKDALEKARAQLTDLSPPASGLSLHAESFAIWWLAMCSLSIFPVALCWSASYTFSPAAATVNCLSSKNWSSTAQCCPPPKSSSKYRL